MMFVLLALAQIHPPGTGPQSFLVSTMASAKVGGHSILGRGGAMQTVTGAFLHVNTEFEVSPPAPKGLSYEIRTHAEGISTTSKLFGTKTNLNVPIPAPGRGGRMLQSVESQLRIVANEVVRISITGLKITRGADGHFIFHRSGKERASSPAGVSVRFADNHGNLPVQIVLTSKAMLTHYRGVAEIASVDSNLGYLSFGHQPGSSNYNLALEPSAGGRSIPKELRLSVQIEKLVASYPFEIKVRMKPARSRSTAVPKPVRKSGKIG